jgi:hypothetical protein
MTLNKEDKRIFYTYLSFGLVIGIILSLGRNYDFAVYYKAVQDLFGYGWGRVYDPISVVPFKYHPFSLFLFVPFSVLGFTAGKILWGIFNGLLVFHVLWMLYSNYKTKISTVLIALFILGHPLVEQFKMANVTFVMMWLLTAFVFSKNGFIKALCLSILVIIKPFWLFIPFLYILSKEYRVVLYFILLMMVFTFIPLLFGSSMYGQWFLTLTHPEHAHNYSKVDNQCIYSFLYRHYDLLSPYLSYLWVLASGAFFAVWYYLRFGLYLPFIKRRLTPKDIFSSVLVILWVGPLSWFHNYLLLLPLVAIYLQKQQKHKKLLWTVLWIVVTGISLLPHDVKWLLYIVGVPLLFLVIMLIIGWETRITRATPS